MPSAKGWARRMKVFLAAVLIVLPLILLVLVVWWVMRRNQGTMPHPKDRTAGWKTDPIGPGERYWDGERWSEESRPAS
jgi:hypothetical protein